jgi:hypothetical protein
VVIRAGGGRICSPPRRLKSIVTEPKSVCLPKVVLRSLGGCGGALTIRIWSPDATSKRCKDESVLGGR